MREGRNSAVHYVAKSEIEGLQAKIMHVNGLTGLYYPLDQSDKNTINRCIDVNALPIPPVELRHGYGTDDVSYLNSGMHHYRLFNNLFEKHFTTSAEHVKILDFGCSSGRIVRFYSEKARNGNEVWGCDIDSASIDWCQKNLMPPLKLFTNTTSAHLPFKDGYFDFIYAGSVFTHINEMTSAWILELSRCTAENGVAVFTFHSELSLDYIYAYEFDQTSKFANTSKTLRAWELNNENLISRGNMCFESSAWWLSAWYSTEYFSRLCGLGYRVLEIIPAFYGYQTAIVLRK